MVNTIIVLLSQSAPVSLWLFSLKTWNQNYCKSTWNLKTMLFKSRSFEESRYSPCYWLQLLICTRGCPRCPNALAGAGVSLWPEEMIMKMKTQIMKLEKRKGTLCSSSLILFHSDNVGWDRGEFRRTIKQKACRLARRTVNGHRWDCKKKKRKKQKRPAGAAVTLGGSPAFSPQLSQPQCDPLKEHWSDTEVTGDLPF